MDRTDKVGKIGKLLAGRGLGLTWSRPRLFDSAALAYRRYPLMLPALLLAASVTALAIDKPVALWCLHDHTPAALRKLFMLSEPFGHGIGVLLFALAVAQLDRLRRWAVPRLLLISLGAGVLADFVKLLVTRIRPHNFDVLGTEPGAFGPWLPLTSSGSVGQSFPSGHVAAAVGLACALSALYPRGRWLFTGFAVLVACQRLEEGSHYVSDVLFGAAIGSLVAAFCLRCGPLPALFDRQESLWRSARRRLLRR